MYIHRKIKDWKTTVVRCLLFLLSFNDIVISCVQGKVEERKPLLVLFSDEAMKIILSTAA